MLFHAGVGAGDALTLLAEESEGSERTLLAEMAGQVDGGASLSAAMRETGRFPVYVCGLVEVGEQSGQSFLCALWPVTMSAGPVWTGGSKVPYCTRR